MVAHGPSNILARHVTDDLIDFSETTSMNNDSDVDVSSLGGLGVTPPKSGSSGMIERERVKQIEAIRKCTTPKPLYVPVKTEKEKPLLLDIGYPHLDVGSRTRVTNTRVKCVCAFTLDKDVFPRCLDHIMSKIDEHKWALFYCIPKKSLEKGLKLLHTDNDVHSILNAAVKNGSIHLYVAHKKQNLGKYYYKNMEWEEEDAGLRFSSSSPFTTRYKRKIIKCNKIGLRIKVKSCVIHDDGANRNRKKTLVNGGNKGKENSYLT
ncbi:hypothetical protein Tco_0030776 [Tanacetum coccineum]